MKRYTTKKVGKGLDSYTILDTQTGEYLALRHSTKFAAQVWADVLNGK